MGWKNWPYWLRGGIIGVIVYPIIVIISLILIWKCIGEGFYLDNKTLCYSFGLALLPIIIFYPLVFPAYKFFLSLNLDDEINLTIVVIAAILFSVIISFLVGILIGFIIGKIKGKNA